VCAYSRQDLENAEQRGKTEASLEGIAKAVDGIQADIKGLPCGKHTVQIERNTSGVKGMWALLITIAGALGAWLGLK